MKKKIILGLAIVGTSVAVLGGCGSSSKSEANSSETVSTAQNNSSDEKKDIQYNIEKTTFSNEGIELTFFTVNFNSDWEKLTEDEKVNITIQALKTIKEKEKTDNYLVSGFNTDLPESEGTIFTWSDLLKETLYLYDKGESKEIPLSEEQLKEIGF